MSNTTHQAPILNPNIYLNYLTPSEAIQFEVARNLYLATLGALLWDILSSLPQDFRILIGSRFSLTKVAYFTARAAALGYVLISVVAKTHPLKHCQGGETGIGICWIIAIASSSFLFLRRVQALFGGKGLVIYFFTFIWFANVGISVVTPFAAHSGPLAQTGYCVNTGVRRYASVSVIMSFVFDSLVLLAISWKIATVHGHAQNDGQPISTTSALRLLLSGKSIPRVSRALLQGGQQYYLITVGANILVLVLILTPSVPPVYEAAFTIPEIALQASMACRVFRNLKSEALNRSTTLSTVKFTLPHGSHRRNHGYSNSGLQTSSSVENGTQDGTVSDQSSPYVIQVNGDLEGQGKGLSAENRSTTEASRSTHKFDTINFPTLDLEKGGNVVDLEHSGKQDMIPLGEMQFEEVPPTKPSNVYKTK